VLYVSRSPHHFLLSHLLYGILPRFSDSAICTDHIRMCHLRLAPISCFLYYLISFVALFRLSLAAYEDSNPRETPNLDLDMRRMFCHGSLPHGKYGRSVPSWDVRRTFRAMACGPQDWSALNFTTLADLCTEHGNPDGNYGGAVRTHRRVLYTVAPTGEHSSLSFLLGFVDEDCLPEHTANFSLPQLFFAFSRIAQHLTNSHSV
jgi:hypothetical protein